VAEYAFASQEARTTLVAKADADPGVDPVATGSIKNDARPYWP